MAGTPNYHPNVLVPRHNATVVITNGDSYRMKDAKHRKENPKTTT